VLASARIEKGPDNVGAQVGSSVELKCRFHHRSCRNMLWTQTDQRSSTTILYNVGSMSESHGDRYSVNVSQLRECTLHINRLQLSDAGTFTCIEVVPGASQVKKAATVTVIGRCILLFQASYYNCTVFMPTIHIHC